MKPFRSSQIHMRCSSFRHATAVTRFLGLALCLHVGLVRAGQFEVFVTQSPPGPQNTDPASWGGVLQYHVNATGDALTPGAGINKTNLSDPSSLAFRPASGELFVANRHGNNNPSSISRFSYDAITRQLTPNGTITGNGLYGVHQIAFNPVSGEMFAANFNNGVSRFTFSPDGNAVANGIIGNGSARGVAVSPNGRRLYMTGGINGLPIRQFDLTTGAELASLNVPSGVGGLHYFQFQGDLLYLAALSDDCVYRYTLDASDNLILKDSIGMNDPVSVMFSPDGEEMFVSGHRTSDLIYRFRHNSGTEVWTETETFDAQSSLGGILCIPSGPQLTITLDHASNSASISWPLPAPGWVLQQTSSLEAGSLLWTEISPPYETNAARASVTVNSATGKRFFRLFHP